MSSSRVGDAIDDLVTEFVLAQLLLVDRGKVTGEALRLNRVHDRGTLLYAFGRVGVHEAEIFERLRVGCREFEVCRHVSRQPIHTQSVVRQFHSKSLVPRYLLEAARLWITVNQFLQATKLFGLALREILFVR
jgi:hypothetical protein